MADRIDQTITINAGLERVWELVSEPGWWVPSGVPAPVERAPGQQIVRETEEWGRFVVGVVRLEPQRYAAFRWAGAFPGETPGPGRSTLVEFFVTERGGAVEVRVMESGFAGLDLLAQACRSAWWGNTSGWREQLAGLTVRAQVSAA